MISAAAVGELYSQECHRSTPVAMRTEYCCQYDANTSGEATWNLVPNICQASVSLLMTSALP